MSKLNTKRKTAPVYNAEGGRAVRISAEQELRRSVMSCLLWENSFYENGEDIALRIEKLVQKVEPAKVVHLAREASQRMKLRHVPLLLAAAFCKHYNNSSMGRELVCDVITRVDSLTEIVAIVAKINGVTGGNVRKHLSNQMKKGIRDAFGKFDEYQFAKYDRDGDIKLRDVYFMTHPTGRMYEGRFDLYKRLVDGKLAVPDTWEVNLSRGGDKKETFTRLLTEGKLGYLALLRNLRNMEEAGVDSLLINRAIRAGKGAERVLPFRYVAAARHAPRYQEALDEALMNSINFLPRLEGRTVILVDVSGSMTDLLSSKSDLSRMDAACTLASVINAEERRVFSFSNNCVEVRAHRGLEGVKDIKNSQPHGSTYLSRSLEMINNRVDYDRIIVITDEQNQDGSIPSPKNATFGYLINVSTEQHGVGYGKWKHIDGFSENVFRYIAEVEHLGLE